MLQKYLIKTNPSYLYIYIYHSVGIVTNFVFVSDDEKVLFTSVGGLEIVGSRCVF
jgi:hypothetical protein